MTGGANEQKMQDYGQAPSKQNYPTKCWQCGCDFMGAALSRYCSYRCTNDAHIARRKERRAAARVKVCKFCGDQFTATRADGIYCGPACRQSAYRKRVTDKACGKFTATGKRNARRNKLNINPE